MTDSGTILVGADGSDGSRRALLWALQEARLRGSRIEVVTALDPRHPGTIEENAATALVDEVVGGEGSDIDVSSRAEEGNPLEVLVNLSAGAELLVLGSHGTSSLIHAALGSVSDACARLAACPVVVVPNGAVQL